MIRVMRSVVMDYAAPFHNCKYRRLRAPATNSSKGPRRSVALLLVRAGRPYSLRSASVGSMRRPRRAGPSDATTPTRSINATAPGRMPGMGKPPICSIGT
jgi:hypothetical protein